MALSILDGNQSATTLSTILTSGQHITAHTVVSLGTQAITDMRGAVSGSVVSISNFPATQPVSIASVTIGSLPAISGTVTIGAGTAQIGSVTASISGTVPVSISSVTVSNSVTIGSLPAIAGTVTANVIGTRTFVDGNTVTVSGFLSVGGWDAVNSQHAPIPLTDGGFGVRVGFDDTTGAPFQVTNHPSVPLSATVTVGNSVTIGSLPAISGTVTVGAVSTTVTIAHHQGTSVTTSNFTSTTASTQLAAANASREVLTIFNEGAGNLHICAGATCTTIAYQVRLSAGDYYEVPLNQTSLTHSAVFATAGTARVTEIS